MKEEWFCFLIFFLSKKDWQHCKQSTKIEKVINKTCTEVSEFTGLRIKKESLIVKWQLTLN